MNKELIKSLEAETSEKLFYYFKHDGAINFEKKIIAGRILNEREYDKTILSQEKSNIANSITNSLKINEDLDYLTKKSKKQSNRNIAMGLGYLSFFLILGMKDYWFNKEDIDWLYLLIMISLGLTFIVYKIVTYKKTLNDFIREDVENNELLRFRLKLIETEWDF
ncbi:MAG: hypothetical protein JEZ03_05445 [Bacteroidales bacterium]|nr:hypothetical protein [Bacteroidales bacterium]